MRCRSDSVSGMTEDTRPECFIAMPITVHPEEQKVYGDAEHWKHVMEQLFLPAIELAGFKPVKPFATGSGMIHARIVQYLATAPLVLCDLSQHNANVMFELGVRTSVDKPIVLVKDEHTKLPFDIGGINTHEYSSGIESWRLDAQRKELAEHIRETGATLEEGNPMWRRFGTGIVASAPTSNESPIEARLDVLTEQINTLLQQNIGGIPNPLASPEHSIVVAHISEIPGVTGVRLGHNRNGLQLSVGTDEALPKEQEGRVRTIENALQKLGVMASFVSSSPTRMIFMIGNI